MSSLVAQTTHSSLAVCLSIAVAAATACGGSGGEGGPDGGDAHADAGPPVEGWQTLIEGTWTLAPRDEGYICVYKTVDRTMLAHEFEPILPAGTHHTVVFMGDPSRADGVYPCTSGTGSAAVIAGSGAGTDPVTFPDGVAVRIEEGQQLVLNLHVFNATDAELTGTSGIRVYALPADQVEHEAEVVLTGNPSFELDPGEGSAEGFCTVEDATTLFGVFPHMHQLGTHATVDLDSAALGQVSLHDQPYVFDDQDIYLFEAIDLAPGDTLTTRCTFYNSTGHEVSAGSSSLEEMCFVVLFQYPVTGRKFCFS